MKVTQWFRCTEKPTRPGMYELKPVNQMPTGLLANFNGKLFSSIDFEWLEDKYFRPNATPKQYEWRGLADKPQEGK